MLSISTDGGLINFIGEALSNKLQFSMKTHPHKYIEISLVYINHTDSILYKINQRTVTREKTLTFFMR
jgi:hypothetical protein